MLPLEDALEALEYLIGQFADVEERTPSAERVEVTVANLCLDPDDHESWEAFSHICDSATAHRHFNKLHCFGGEDQAEVRWRFFTDSDAIGCGKVEWNYVFGGDGRVVQVSWDFGQFSNKPIVIRAITNEKPPDDTPSE